MPRHFRNISPTNIYHIMIRGIEKKEIFKEDGDKEKFLTILEKKKKLIAFDLYCYCLMDNHVHLIINDCNNEISRIMKGINVSYAKYFNEKYDRVGYLFQDRFKSEVINGTYYLLGAVRYIHNNPVKAKMVSSSRFYRWSSYREYLNEHKANSLVDKDFILDMFSDERKKAVEEFVLFSNKDDDDKNVYLEDKRNDKEDCEKIYEVVDEKDEQIRITINKFIDDNVIELEKMRGRCSNETAKLRDKLILDLKRNHEISNRSISKYTGISRSVVDRVSSLIESHSKSVPGWH